MGFSFYMHAVYVFLVLWQAKFNFIQSNFNCLAYNQSETQNNILVDFIDLRELLDQAVFSSSSSKMNCSFNKLVKTECGTVSSSVSSSQEIISLSLCKKDVSKHLHTISVADISTEQDLILARAGVFEYDEELLTTTTVCPRHRFQLGGGWFQKRICRYPEHSGKAKPDRSINKLQSNEIYFQFGTLVQVGSGKATLIT